MTTSAEQDRAASVRETLDEIEEKLAAASYKRRMAERELGRIDERLRLIALDAVDGSPDACEEYVELEAERERQGRTLEMATYALSYGEERADSYRRMLRAERIAERFGAEAR